MIKRPRRLEDQSGPELRQRLVVTLGKGKTGKEGLVASHERLWLIRHPELRLF